MRSPAKGHASPAAEAPLRLSWIVLRATPSVRPISRAVAPSRASRSILSYLSHGQFSLGRHPISPSDQRGT